MDVLRRLGLLSALVLVVACGAEPESDSAGTMGANGEAGNVLLRNVYLAASGSGGYVSGDDGLVRLWLFNQSSVEEALVGVRSPVAESARITWDRDCDGVYETVEELPVLPNGTVPYDRPYAVELVNFTGEVHGGTTVPITFTFRHAGETKLDAMVEVVADGDVPDPVRCTTTTRPRHDHERNSPGEMTKPTGFPARWRGMPCGDRETSGGGDRHGGIRGSE